MEFLARNRSINLSVCSYHLTSDLTFKNNLFARGWAWGLCLGSGVSLAVACFVLTRLGQLYAFYVLAGTLCLAGLVTALRMFTRDRRKLAGA